MIDRDIKMRFSGQKMLIPAVCAFIFCVLCLTSCAGVFRVALGQDFVIVDVQPGDTLSSISKTYIGDSDAAWRIAEFNNIEGVTPGERIIVPLADYRIGGLYKNGYQTVPVLTYHNFFVKGTGDQPVTRKLFQEQMSFLEREGFNVISMDRFMDFLDFDAQIHPKSVVITIDDIDESVYSVAFPVLKRFGYRATLFVTTDLIGGEGNLTWDKIGEMNVNGIDVCSKTRTQRDLTKPLEGESNKNYRIALEQELLGSKKAVEKNLLRECKYLAYPHGIANGMIVTWVKRFGYLGAFTLQSESNPFYVNRFFVNRTVIAKETGISGFQKKLAVFREKELR